MVRILGQTTLHQVAEVDIDLWLQLVEWRRFLRQLRADAFAKGTHPGQQLVRQHTHTVNVRLLGDRLTAQLFRTHVQRIPHRAADRGQPFGVLGPRIDQGRNSKIHEHYPSCFLLQDHVSGPYVPMYDVFAMGGRQRRRNRCQDPPDLIDR